MIQIDSTVSDLPENSLRQATNANVAASIGTHDLMDATAAFVPWPFTTADAPPLAWWRLLPAEQFRDAEHLVMRTTLDRLTIMKIDRRWYAALRGDVVAAVGIVVALMPVETITLQTDIVMTAVLCSALADDDPTASLILAHVLNHARLDHPFGPDLAQSWRTFDKRFAARHRARERIVAAASGQAATDSPLISRAGDMS